MGHSVTVSVMTGSQVLGEHFLSGLLTMSVSGSHVPLLLYLHPQPEEMNCVMRKLAFYLSENKGADQLRD